MSGIVGALFGKPKTPKAPAPPPPPPTLSEVDASARRQRQELRRRRGLASTVLTQGLGGSARGGASGVPASRGSLLGGGGPAT